MVFDVWTDDLTFEGERNNMKRIETHVSRIAGRDAHK